MKKFRIVIEDNSMSNLSEIENDLKSGNLKKQLHALKSIAEYKAKDATNLVIDILLNNNNSTLRAEAAWTLGEIGGKEAMKALAKAVLNDPESRVRLAAGKALANLIEDM